MLFSRLRSFLFILALFGLFGVLLAFIFSGQWILPQSIMMGSIQVRFYGLIMATAVIAGYVLAVCRSEKYGINRADAERLIFWAVVGGFVGARLYHVLSSWQYYLANPIDIIKVWNGGLGIFGAMAGGAVVGVLIYFTQSRGVNTSERRGNQSNEQITSPSALLTTSQDNKKQQIPRPTLLSLLDWGAPSFVLGQIIGRFGNLFNYEAFGYATSLPWKMFVPEHFRPIESIHSAFYHPLFLYEALGNIVILLVLLQAEKKNRVPGTLFFGYLFLYNTLRFFIEFLRTDSTFIGSIRLNSMTSGVLAVVGIIGLVVIKNSKIQISNDK